VIDDKMNFCLGLHSVRILLIVEYLFAVAVMNE